MSTIPKKNLVALVSNSSGTFIQAWPDFTFDSFIMNINGGLGECILKLARQFDTYGADLFLGNIVELRIADKDTIGNLGAASAVTIYRGYISMIERDANGAQEGMTIHLLGFYSLLAMDILKSGSQTTLVSNTTYGLYTGTQASCDVALMARAVIDRYRAETTNPQVNYDVANVPLTSTPGTYRFAQKTYADALDALRRLAPSKTYFYIGADGMLKFKTGNTTPDHHFIIGKHISKINVQSNIETMRNAILIWDGKTASSVYKHYQDADSIATYGRRCATLNDYGIDNVDAADLIGNKFIAENKVPETKITATIIDNNGDANFGYDIESIQPGNTCSFSGFNISLNEIFPYTMLITKVTYKLDSAEIEAEIVRTTMQDMQYLNDRNTGELGTGGLKILDSYT